MSKPSTAERDKKSNKESVDIGLYSKRVTDQDFAGQPCLFLDRDGVIVEDTHYLHRVQDIEFIPELPKAIERANHAGIAVVIVTNQAGIGRGYYGWPEFEKVQGAILKHLSDAHGNVDMVLACAYHADALGSFGIADHPWRKPKPGMLMEAANTLGIDLANSFIVGDSISDLEAGSAAGLRRGTLVMTGHGKREYSEKSEIVFEEWKSDGRFEATVAETAAKAIFDWIESINLRKDVP
ncbi:MAG: HAD family hydrolase [Alphaproteobacteria bacterium]|nr:HAD family hydrolase [Alphaproteobacteria bacterium]